MLVARTRSIDKHIVVGPFALAAEQFARCAGAHHALITAALLGLAPHEMARIRDAAKVDHRFLHGNFYALANTGELALIQRRENADGAMEAGAGVPYGRPWPQRWTAHSTGRRDRAAH